MAVTSTSLASQVAGPTSLSYSPNFSGLRRSCSKLDHSNSISATQSLFQHLHSHLRLSSSRKGSRAVVTMAGTGKVFFLFILFFWKKRRRLYLIDLQFIYSSYLFYFYLVYVPSKCSEWNWIKDSFFINVLLLFLEALFCWKRFEKK